MTPSLSRAGRLLAAAVATAAAALCLSVAAVAGDHDQPKVTRASLPPGSIEHVLVIDLENESYGTTFGPTSPAVYLNTTLLKQGKLLVNHFGTSHVSLGNYIAQVSGQGPTPAINNDCLDLASLRSPPLLGAFTDVAPGTDAADQVQFPGQVVGDGCVFPAPGRHSRGARTIGDQLDAMYSDDHEEQENRGHDAPHGSRVKWRQYAEDMGADPLRDYGSPDALGGTACAHPPIGGADHSNGAAANDQYATRHNPFVYFHSLIDDPARCALRVARGPAGECHRRRQRRARRVQRPPVRGPSPCLDHAPFHVRHPEPVQRRT